MPAASASRRAVSLSARSREPSPSCTLAAQSLKAAWSSSEATAFASSSLATKSMRTLSTPMNMPRPNSAASSNKLLAHAGPWPAAFVVYGATGADAPQMEEQPVALAIIMRSPKSCVTSLTYGVSPQPAHAPENSRSGVSNWEPITLYLFCGLAFGATFSVP